MRLLKFFTPFASLALSMTPHGASAQEMQPPSVDDVAAVKACIAATGDNPQSCIGRLSNACQDRPDGSSTIGIGQCTMGETAVWDKILNENYAAALKAARKADSDNGVWGDSSAEATLQTAERAWIAYRDAECSRLYALNQGGTIRSTIHAYCQLNLTAERAFALEPDAAN